MNIAICDDELAFCEKLKNSIEKMLEQQNNYSVSELNTFTNPELLLESSQNFDVIFLDIVMPEVDGISIAKKLVHKNKNVKIVFVTNYDDLVFDALEVYPFAFLRKQNTLSQLVELFQKIRNASNSNDFIMRFSSSTGDVFINLSDVLCFTSVGHSVYAVTSQRAKIKIKHTLKLLEKAVENQSFVRCHTSYIVNTKYIFSIEKDKIILDNNDEIPLSRYRAESVKNALLNLMRDF